MIVPKGCRSQWNVMVAHRGYYSEGMGWKFWEGKVQYFIKGKIIWPVSLVCLKVSLPFQECPLG